MLGVLMYVAELHFNLDEFQRACFYVAVSALVLCLFSTGCMFFGVYSVNLWLDVFLIVLNTVVSVLVLVGLYTEKPGYLIPFIFSEVKLMLIVDVSCFLRLSVTLLFLLQLNLLRYETKFGLKRVRV